MALNISSISSALLPNAASQIAALTKSGALDQSAALSGIAGLSSGGSGDDYSIGSTTDLLSELKSPKGTIPSAAASLAGKAGKADSFEQALLKAMDGVSATQNKSDNLLQQVVADPNSVDVQDVTIAMAEANMSLNLAKTILSRVVTAWKDVINTH
jgi:flagellar hook-basal body complex protein FliE